MDFTSLYTDPGKSIRTIEGYQDIVLRVAKTFEDHLQNSAFFKQKLSMLNVTFGLTDQPLTIGNYINYATDYSTNLKLVLLINDSNPFDYIVFVIAHELAHLLIDRFTPRYRIFMEGETTAKVTELTRMRKDDDSCYGGEFEEQVCDILGLFILNKVHTGKWSKFLEDDLAKTRQIRLLTSSLINAFGEPITHARFIDEVRETNDDQVMNNLFWFLLVNQEFEKIISAYETIMGKDSWEHLLGFIENWQDKASFKMAQSEIKRYKYFSSLEQD